MDLPGTPMYSSGQLMSGHLNLYITLHFFEFVVPVLGGHEKGFNGVGPIEMYLDTQAVACPFEPFPSLWMSGTTIEMFLCDPLLLLLLGC